MIKAAADRAKPCGWLSKLMAKRYASDPARALCAGLAGKEAPGRAGGQRV